MHLKNSILHLHPHCILLDTYSLNVQLDLITKYSLIHFIHPNRMSLEISVLIKIPIQSLIQKTV